MTFEEAKRIALKYSLSNGYDGIVPSAVRDGYMYFHLFRNTPPHHKTGLPFFIKIAESDGSISFASGWEESIWAWNKMGKLENL